MPGGLAELNRQDPEKTVGVRLPQPYRRIAKVVDGIWDEAWREIESRHPELLGADDAEAAKRRHAAARLAPEGENIVLAQEALLVVTCYLTTEEKTVVIGATAKDMYCFQQASEQSTKAMAPFEIPMEWTCIAVAAKGAPRRVAVGGNGAVAIAEVWHHGMDSGPRIVVLKTFETCALRLCINAQWCSISDQYGNTGFHRLPEKKKETNEMQAIAEEDAVDWQQQDYDKQLANLSTPTLYLPAPAPIGTARGFVKTTPSSSNYISPETATTKPAPKHSKNATNSTKKMPPVQKTQTEQPVETPKKLNPPPHLLFFPSTNESGVQRFFCAWPNCNIGLKYLLPSADTPEDLKAPKELSRYTMPCFITAATLLIPSQSECYSVEIDDDTVLTLDPPHPLVALAGCTGLCCIWDLDNDFCTYLLRKHDAPATAILCSSDGRRLVSADAEGIVHIYALAERRTVAPKLLARLRLGTTSVHRLAVLGVVNIVAATLDQGTVILIDLERAHNIGLLPTQKAHMTLCGHDAIFIKEDEHISIFRGHNLISHNCQDLAQFPSNALPELIFQLFRYPQLSIDDNAQLNAFTPTSASKSARNRRRGSGGTAPSTSSSSVAGGSIAKSPSSRSRSPSKRRNKSSSALTAKNVSAHQEKFSSSNSTGPMNGNSTGSNVPLPLLYDPRRVVAEAIKDSLENGAEREKEFSDLFANLENQLSNQ